MAGFTEVRVPPAEPLRNGAAELALEFNEVRPVLGAVLNARADTNRRALPADQLLRLEVGPLLAGLAVLHAPEVGRLTLEAHVVGQLVDGVGPQVVEEPVLGILQPVMLVYPLELGPLHDLLQHVVLDPLGLAQLLHQGRAVGCVDPLLALGTLQVAEDHSRTGPPVLDLGENTVQVEYMVACQLHTGRLPQSLSIADNTVIVIALAESQLLLLGHALIIQTGQALLLIIEPTARMATRQHLIATLIH